MLVPAGFSVSDSSFTERLGLSDRGRFVETETSFNIRFAGSRKIVGSIISICRISDEDWVLSANAV